MKRASENDDVDDLRVKQAVDSFMAMNGRYSKPLFASGTTPQDLGQFRGEFVQTWTPTQLSNAMALFAYPSLTWKLSLLSILTTESDVISVTTTLGLKMLAENLLLVPFPTGTQSDSPMSMSQFQMSRSNASVKFYLDSTSTTSTALSASCTVGNIVRPFFKNMPQTIIGTNTVDPNKRKLGIQLGKGNGIEWNFTSNSSFELVPTVGQFLSQSLAPVGRVSQAGVSSVAISRWTPATRLAVGPNGAFLTPFNIQCQNTSTGVVSMNFVQVWEKHELSVVVQIPPVPGTPNIELKATVVNVCEGADGNPQYTTNVVVHELFSVLSVQYQKTYNILIGPADGSSLFCGIYWECISESGISLFAFVTQGMPCEECTDAPSYVARIDNVGNGQQVVIQEKYVEEGTVPMRNAVNTVPYIQRIENLLTLREWERVSQQMENEQVRSIR